MSDITVISVGYFSSALIAFLDRCLSETLDGTHEWRVIDNSPDESERDALRALSNVTVVDSEVRERINSAAYPYGTGSYQHGFALNELVPQVDTPYGLIIDPDFFPVAHEWDAKLITEMQRTETAVIGAPYHPTRRDKYTGFPMVSFLFFQTHAFLPLNIDFTPDVKDDWKSIWYQWSLLRRLMHGRRRDTGWRIPNAFRKNGIRSRTLDVAYFGRSDRSTRLRRALKRCVPERLLSMPRKLYRPPNPGLISMVELARRADRHDYEEFWFRDQLFACHLRGSNRGIRFEDENTQFWLRRVAGKIGFDFGEWVQKMRFGAGVS